MSAKRCEKRYAVYEVNHRFDIVDTFFYIARIRAGLVLPGRRECQGNPGPLADLFRAANLQAVDVRSLDVPTAFVDFNDYWSPLLRGQGPAGPTASHCRRTIASTCASTWRKPCLSGPMAAFI